jgi:hypothetical protein
MIKESPPGERAPGRAYGRISVYLPIYFKRHPLVFRRKG